MQAREVLNLRFSAALVTLSACDTSAGAQLGQDGVASLVRPFLAAGAKAVVANLWSVDDTFSAALMKQFYGHLTNGKDAERVARDFLTNWQAGDFDAMYRDLSFASQEANPFDSFQALYTTAQDTMTFESLDIQPNTILRERDEVAVFNYDVTFHTRRSAISPIPTAT